MELLANLPERLQGVDRELDGRAMSGTESKLRLAFMRAGLRVECQVAIPGVGIVDLLVDGWLIVEVDSRKYHDGEISQHKDRVRDGNSVLGNYGYLRFDYALVQFEREWCVDVTLARLKSGRP
jgi:very-short-patch-repair endonuclease